MAIQAKFVHPNIVAQNWQRLAQFYQEVFGCVPVPPERNLHGPEVDALTGLSGAQIRGIHLRLPGYGDSGPTLEIFTYNQAAERPPTAINRPGFAHIAFTVDDVRKVREVVLAAGGGETGQIVDLRIPGAGTVTLAYLTDPEGNIIEVQSWSK